MNYNDILKLYDIIPSKLKEKHNVYGISEWVNSKEHYYEVHRLNYNEKMSEENIVIYFQKIIKEREEKLERILK